MSFKRRAQLEFEELRERRAAQRWADKHGVGSLPGRRLETGESAMAQRVGHPADPTDASEPRSPEGLPREHRDTLSYSAHETLDEWELWMLDAGRGYTPLVGANQPQPTMDSLEKRSRMNHVFTYMLPKHVELLYWRHIEGMTLEAISRQESVSRQAIAKRIAVAEADFKSSFAAHWNDDVTWEV